MYSLGLAIPAQAARLALVIGNNNYASINYLDQKPLNDAKEITRLLTRVGFKVDPFYDLNHEDFEREIRLFGKKIQKGDEVVVYYSGHGAQHQQRNYLIPIGAISKVSIFDHLKHKAVNVNYLLDTLSTCGEYCDFRCLS